MKYKIYKVVAEEKLDDVAKKYNISAEKIKEVNPNIRFFKTLTGKEYVEHSQNLRIPIIIKNNEIESLNFIKTVRYRCNQNNITKALESVTFSSTIKTQYFLSVSKNDKKHFKTLLEDYILQINPKELEASFDLIKPIEFFKNNIIFTHKNGDFSEILNIDEIMQKWMDFKNKKLPNIEFYRQLKNQNNDTANDFIKTGDLEFTDETKFKETLSKNLFFNILLKSNTQNTLDEFSFTQYSQIFPNQELKINVKRVKVSENQNSAMYKLIGELEKENLSEINLKKQYDEIYKPMLKFSFTEFNYIYRITYNVDLKTGFIIDAKASLCEKVKNNFESITQFAIKQVEL